MHHPLHVTQQTTARITQVYINNTVNKCVVTLCSFLNFQFWHSAVLEIKLDQLVSASKLQLLYNRYLYFR
jgi:hypothetical protein